MAILAWIIPWTEESGKLQSIESYSAQAHTDSGSSLRTVIIR